MIKTKRMYDAEKTRKKILSAASHLFIKKGFEGASISEIAEKAGIRQSLIYHHFKNKEDLWKEVKLDIFEKSSLDDFKMPTEPKDLRSFLEEIIRSRFAYYDQNPDFLRMMTWQKLEKEKSRLAGTKGMAPIQWKEGIVFLQKKGKIKSDIEPEMIIVWIASSVAGALSEDYVGLQKDPKRKKAYIEMIIDGLEKALC